jgi:hypothetical protein
VQLLFENMNKGWSYKIEVTFGRRSGILVCCTKYSPDIWEYFSQELQKVKKRKKSRNEDKRAGEVARDAHGLLWVDPSTDPRDPACLAWVMGWLDPPAAPIHRIQALTQTNHTT